MLKISASTLIAGALLASCATVPYEYLQNYRREANLSAEAIRGVLLSELRSNYTVSETDGVFKFESGPYPAKAKGLFGFGPIWQEKMLFSVQAVPSQRERAISTSGQNRFLLRIGFVQLKTTVLERQSATFEWQEKNGRPIEQWRLDAAVRNIDLAITRAQAASGDMLNESIH